jgi:hypothetical protein
MKKTLLLLVLVSFATLAFASHADGKDHVPKKELASKVKLENKAVAEFSASYEANDVLVYNVPSPQLALTLGQRPGSDLKKEVRQISRKKQHGSFSPRIRDGDRC